ncbi:MAG: Helix-turn-helix domain [Bacteroidota bacterium]|jgi:transcriptional regulator with XRE-family HTH domain
MKERVSNDAAYLKALGKAIAAKRKALNMTQADLASIINMEVPNLSVIENGKSNPQILTITRIASALQIQTQALLPIIDDPSIFLEAPAVYQARKH